MMDSSGNAQTRRVHSKRSDRAGRGNITSYDRARTEVSGQTRRARSGNSKPTYSVRTAYVGTGRQRTSSSYAGTGKQRTSPAYTGTSRQKTSSTYTGTSRQRTRPQGVCSTRTNERNEKKRRAGRRARKAQIFAFLWIAAMCVVIFFMGKIFMQNMQKSPVMKEDKTEQSRAEDIPVLDNSDDANKPTIREDFLTFSEYNRPGTKLSSVNNIFVHYTANPGTSAAQNRSYFESLGQTHERAASAHFIIGYEGEIVQCIPLDEEAYAVVEHNGDSLSIECCYLEADGSFTQETYDSLIVMLAWLTERYDLETQDILRHYDCGGKKCPLYYVEHEDAWQRLLEDVRQYRNENRWK